MRKHNFTSPESVKDKGKRNPLAVRLTAFLTGRSPVHESRAVAALFNRPAYPMEDGTAKQYADVWQWEANAYGKPVTRINPVTGIGHTFKPTIEPSFVSILQAIYQQVPGLVIDITPGNAVKLSIKKP